jgi:hypothetical protein
MHGLVLQPEVKRRIEQSDAAIGFMTIREGQGAADFTSHLWVRDELLHASAKDKPIFPIKEQGVRMPDGLLGDRQFIELRQEDRLACVADLVSALGQQNMRRLKLEPESDSLRRNLKQWKTRADFAVRYKVRDENLMESDYRDGRLEQIDQAFYLDVSGLGRRSFVEVLGLLAGDPKFSSGWVSADAVSVKI